MGLVSKRTRGPEGPMQPRTDRPLTLTGAKTVLSAHVLKQLDTRTHANGLDAHLTPVTDDNSAWPRPECRGETVKLLEDNMGGNPGGPVFSNDFLDVTHETQSVKGRTDEANLTEVKYSCSVKDNVGRMTQATNREKIFAQDVIKDQYPKYAKSSENSVRKHTA